jgi:hypothetical protein
VRVAEDALTEERQVLVQLRPGVEAGAGVVEVDLLARVQALEVARAQLR